MGVREDILTAGVAMLRERGIAALTQPQVAAAAGIKQSHLTYYFPTRADLMLGIVEHSITEVMNAVSERIAAATPDALVKTLADVMIEGVPPRLLIGLIVAADADPAIRVRLRTVVRAVRARIAAMLDSAGMAESAQAPLLFHATVVGLAVMHQAQLNDLSARDVRVGVEAMLHLLFPVASAGAREKK